MSKVLYISGLPHSGSTPLALKLGSAANAVGLGEVHHLLASEATQYGHKWVLDSLCGCLKPMNECPFWSRYLDWSAKVLGGPVGASIDARYGKVVELAGDIYGRDVVVVDSSKTVEGLRLAVNVVPGTKTIHLIKDVRNYVYGIQRRLNKRAPWRGPLYSAYWLRGTEKLEQTIAGLKVEAMRIGYEELCFDEARSVSKVMEFAGLNSEAPGHAPDIGRNHIAMGNRMKASESLAQGIRYDHRWLWGNEVRLAPFIKGRILKRNAQWVYGNLSSSHDFTERGAGTYRFAGG